MSSRSRWKLLGALIVVSVVLGVVVWQQFTQKTVVPVGSVNYYLSLLESNGTEPYVQLAKELRKLPNLRNATAVGKITFLALNATKPEITKALKLMMRVGTPRSVDFKYTVPSWNAELWALYQLAEDSEFQKDDKVALAISLVDGVFRVLGDEEVRSRVRLDDGKMLRLSREIVKWQEERGMVSLSDLPLDASLYWAWRGTTTMSRGDSGLGGGPYALQLFRDKMMPLKAYLWDTIDPDTMKEMRADAEQLGWPYGTDINSIVAKIEDYWYTGRPSHWEYHYVTKDGKSDTIKDVDGVDVEYGEIQNTDWQYYQRFKKDLPGIGFCGAEVAVADSWLKSLGISCNSIGRGPKSGSYTGHNHVIYYDARSSVWKAYEKQVSLGLIDHPTDVQVFMIRKLPIDCRFDSYRMMEIDLTQIRSMFVQNGVSSNQMIEWLLA